MDGQPMRMANEIVRKPETHKVELPALWNGPHVALRLVEGFQALRLLPMRDLLNAQSAWPTYLYEFDDLVAQKQQYELEITQQQQNRARVLPSLREITHAIEVCQWPAKFLFKGHPHLCMAVNVVAFAHSIDRDAGWVTRKRGGFADTWRQRHDRGCEAIADGLIADRVMVF